MGYRAVIFDLDGTLLDSVDDLADSTNITLRQLGFPEHDREAYKYFVGEGLENLARQALPEDHRDVDTLAKCAALLRDEYGRRWADKTRPYEGVPELLDTLASQGIKMAILSNKPDEFTKVVVAKLLPKWRFENVAGSKPSVPKKPDPTVSLQIAETAGIPPSEFIYLGDTHTDMETANAAHMYAVGALWGFRTADELIKSGAKVLIKRPMDLLELLWPSQTMP